MQRCQFHKLKNLRQIYEIAKWKIGIAFVNSFDDLGFVKKTKAGY